MAGSEMKSYETRVMKADTALRDLGSAAREDLDESEGGISWWAGQTDWRRLTLISNYLLDSISGVSQSLYCASLSAQLHRESHHAEDFWIRHQWRAVHRENPRATPDDYLRAIRGGSAERQRRRIIEMMGEHCFYHLAQALDRLAAVVVAVAAVRMPLLEVDWNSFGRLGNAVQHRQPSRYLA